MCIPLAVTQVIIFQPLIARVENLQACSFYVAVSFCGNDINLTKVTLRPF